MSPADAAIREAAEEAGVPRDAAERNYRDANHKPELICALTEFHALVGFREPAETVRLLRDYLGWERQPVLRRRATAIVRRMEETLR